MDNEIKKVRNTIDFDNRKYSGVNYYKSDSNDVEVVELDDVGSFSQEDVLTSIKANFDSNRNLTNEFNKSLYMKLKSDLDKFSLDEGNEHHVSR